MSGKFDRIVENVNISSNIKVFIWILFQRFYQTLSEIKSEVENVIKTGRKLVEERSVSQQYTEKLDMLKELYNKVFDVLLIKLLHYKNYYNKILINFVYTYIHKLQSADLCIHHDIESKTKFPKIFNFWVLLQSTLVKILVPDS